MKLLFKIFLFCIALSIGQYAIFKITHQEIPEITTLNSILNHPDSIIEFSDSVAHNTSSEDTDKRTISEMISSIQPDLHTDLLWHSSYSLVVFDSYMTYIARSDTKPRAIIIPINLDDVSPLNEKYPGQLFERLNFILSTHIPFASVLVQPLAVFKFIDLNTISAQTWLNQKIYNWNEPFSTVKDCYDIPQRSDYSTQSIRALYICEYMTKASMENNNMKALSHLVNTAKNAHIPLLVVVTPVDIEAGVHFVGQSFGDNIASNANFACSIATSQGIPCLNIASSSPDSSFDTHFTYPTPHMNEYGRLQTAKLIAHALSKLLN